MQGLKYGQLTVFITESNSALGEAGAADFTATVTAALETRDEVAVILATGNSQLSFRHRMAPHHDSPYGSVPWDGRGSSGELQPLYAGEVGDSGEAEGFLWCSRRP